MDNPEVYGDNWRWRDDDGNESSIGATFLELENVNHEFNSAALDVNVRLRLTLHVESLAIGGGGQGWQLEYEVNATGGFSQVNAASNVARSSDSTNLTNLDDTTEFSPPNFGGTGAFTIDNDGVEDADGKTPNKVHAVNDYWAIEFCFQLREVDLSNGDSIEFRIVNNGANELFSPFSPRPKATIIIAAGGPTGTSVITLPVPTSVASGTAKHVGTSAITLPVPTSIASGDVTTPGAPPTGTSVITLPVPTSIASGTVKHVGTSAIVLPVPTSTATGSVEPEGTSAITLPLPISTASGTVKHVGTSAIVLPVPTSIASGDVTAPGAPPTGTSAITLPLPTSTATGTVKHVGTSAITLPIPTSAASGQAQSLITGTSAIVLPVPTSTASGTAGSGAATGTSVITLPVPTFAALGYARSVSPPGGILAQTVTLTQETFAAKINKRRHQFNQNTSSMQGGLEMEPVGPRRSEFFEELTSLKIFDISKTDDPLQLENAKEAALQLEKKTLQDRRDIKEVQYALRDLQEAVVELQRLKVTATKVGDFLPYDINDQLPRHGEYCELFDGQFIRVFSDTPANQHSYSQVHHSLKRVPQGVFWIKNSGVVEEYVEGNPGAGLPAATRDTIWFSHLGGISNYSVGILF